MGRLPGPRERRLLLVSRTLAFALTLAIAGCDPLESDAGVGVSLQDGRQVQIHVALCSAETLSELKLLKAIDSVVGNEDDLVLWAISSEAGNEEEKEQGLRIREVLVGVVPAGFEETVPLKGPIPRRQVLDVYKVTGESQQIVTFKVAELSADSIRSEGEVRSHDDFVTHAEEECELRSSP
jgi:hypothetical protein